MDDLLFLTHRIPYPPDKGDKIRSFHWLQGLSAHFRVHLGTFIDDESDAQYLDALRSYCASIHASEMTRLRLTLRASIATLRGEAISLSAYRDRTMTRWVGQTCRDKPIRAALAFSSGVAPYVLSNTCAKARRVIDFVDVDSDKWAQYSRRASYHKRWIYAREARKLARAELNLASVADTSIFVSETEAGLFRKRSAGARAVAAIENGVDCVFFNPAEDFPNPYGNRSSSAVVFTGAMDYTPNVDGVMWFVREVFPAVRQHIPQAVFYVVGSRPTSAVRALNDVPGVHVTGRVPDVRPYLAHASACVAPLRMARGIQNKVLEALAMDRPILATPEAVEGLEPATEVLDAVSNVPAEFSASLIQCITHGSPIPPRSRRAFMLEHFSWERAVDKLVTLLRGASSAG